MNGNRNLSAVRYKVSSGPDFSDIDGMQQHTGPDSGGESLQIGNNQSGKFAFASKSLNPDKPLALSADTSTSLLGARSEMGRMPGMGA